MKTLWDKGSKLNEAIATFTIWDDQTLDAKLARHDVLGSLAHIKTIEKAGVLTHQEMLALKKELIALYALAEAGEQQCHLHGLRQFLAKVMAPLQPTRPTIRSRRPSPSEETHPAILPRSRCR